MGEFFGNLLRILPKNLLSYYVGLFVHYEWPPIVGSFFVRAFVRFYKINMDEAEHSLSHYTSVGTLFTRKLKPGVRVIEEGNSVHPADARLTQGGTLSRGQLVQAKNKVYSLNTFLKNSQADKLWEGGSYWTYYLCPTDYHRVHSPVSGQVSFVNYVPGTLWPVNQWSVENISQLFCENERVIVGIETPQGVVHVVMVGATNVGKISLSFNSSIVSNQPGLRTEKYIDLRSQNKSLSKGDELGIFHMGSTVIVVYPKGFIENVDATWTAHRDSAVQMGGQLSAL